VADICAWGTPEECAEKLADVVAAGAEMIVLNPIRDFEEQMQRLADEVIPLLRS
jgi:alkanesulfonate monooxygenase SsuD/methylene tetrahydromethanopterin reductase-like flavin-dependent oxidoreductase (luciferase family)